MTQIHLEVVTPTGPVVSEDVDIVTAPGTSGDFGVLANHAPFLSTIRTGILTYSKDKQEHHLMVSGGFAEVSSNKVTFLVESAEDGRNIDLNGALTAKAEAEKRLMEAKSKDDDASIARAEAAVKVAVARVKVAELVNSRS